MRLQQNIKHRNEMPEKQHKKPRAGTRDARLTIVKSLNKHIKRMTENVLRCRLSSVYFHSKRCIGISMGEEYDDRKKKCKIYIHERRREIVNNKIKNLHRCSSWLFSTLE